MYTTIFFFTFNYRIHYKTKLKKLLESELLIYGNDSNLLIVFYVQIMPDDFVMQLHRF